MRNIHKSPGSYNASAERWYSETLTGFFLLPLDHFWVRLLERETFITLRTDCFITKAKKRLCSSNREVQKLKGLWKEEKKIKPIWWVQPRPPHHHDNDWIMILHWGGKNTELEGKQRYLRSLSTLFKGRWSLDLQKPLRYQRRIMPQLLLEITAREPARNEEVPMNAGIQRFYHPDDYPSFLPLALTVYKAFSIFLPD